jgi:chromate transporter
MSTEPQMRAARARTRAAAPAPRVAFAEAFRFWLKLGFISFGGPAGQIAIMHRELVERRHWIGEERFLHALNYCMLLPGPEAQQLATYIGWLLHRTWGGIVAGGLFVLPSIFVLVALSYVYAAHGHLPAVIAALAGCKPVVVAIVVEAVLKIGARALKRRVHVVIAAAAFLAIYVLQIPFPFIVLAGAVIGLAGNRFLPDLFGAPPPAPRGQADIAERPAAIDDRAPLPTHAQPSAQRALRTLAVGVALWVVPFALLLAWRGWDSLHAQLYRFFTLAALVTFGGAYAVLAYVTQVATTSYGWITQAQAVDGLALAETTPGPLIMVLQFVGFLAAWQHPEGLSPTASAVIGALLTTYTTFLPSFLFILLGAPYVEHIRGNRAISAALSGVTASVVGVVLNLALVFGTAVIWPQGLAGGPSYFALAVSAAAFVVLYRYHVDVVWVVLAGGALGMLRMVVG